MATGRGDDRHCEPPRRAPAGRHRPDVAADDEPVLPEVSRDDTDIGWGDEPGSRSVDWYLRERPPHHE